MPFYAQTMRSFPVKLPHPDDPAIDWIATAEKMGLLDDEALFDDALAARAGIIAKKRYAEDFDDLPLVPKDGKTISLFEFKPIEDDVRHVKLVEHCAKGQRLGDKTGLTGTISFKLWAYKKYVTKPSTASITQDIEIDLGDMALILSASSISKELADDVPK